MESRTHCLTEPPRVSQNKPVKQRGPAVIYTAVVGTNIKIELLNIQSLPPKPPDIGVDAHQRRPDILCYVETNLKLSNRDRLLAEGGYRLCQRVRIKGKSWEKTLQ